MVMMMMIGFLVVMMMMMMVMMMTMMMLSVIMVMMVIIDTLGCQFVFVSNIPICMCICNFVCIHHFQSENMPSAVESKRWGANMYLYLYLTFQFVCVFVIVFVFSISNQKMCPVQLSRHTRVPICRHKIWKQ